MNAALAQLQEKQAALAEAQEKLREVSLILFFPTAIFLIWGILHYYFPNLIPFPSPVSSMIAILAPSCSMPV
jgi:hypothetical protein